MRIQEVNQLKKYGRDLGRAGLSLSVYSAVDAFNQNRTYKNAMILAGQLKAVAIAAQYDDYWREKVNIGVTEGTYLLRDSSPPNQDTGNTE